MNQFVVTAFQKLKLCRLKQRSAASDGGGLNETKALLSFKESFVEALPKDAGQESVAELLPGFNSHPRIQKGETPCRQRFTRFANMSDDSSKLSETVLDQGVVPPSSSDEETTAPDSCHVKRPANKWKRPIANLTSNRVDMQPMLASLGLVSSLWKEHHVHHSSAIASVSSDAMLPDGSHQFCEAMEKRLSSDNLIITYKSVCLLHRIVQQGPLDLSLSAEFSNLLKSARRVATEHQRRIKMHSLSSDTRRTTAPAAKPLSMHGAPTDYFLDVELVELTVNQISCVEQKLLLQYKYEVFFEGNWSMDTFLKQNGLDSLAGAVSTSMDLLLTSGDSPVRNNTTAKRSVHNSSRGFSRGFSTAHVASPKSGSSSGDNSPRRRDHHVATKKRVHEFPVTPVSPVVALDLLKFGEAVVDCAMELLNEYSANFLLFLSSLRCLIDELLCILPVVGQLIGLLSAVALIGSNSDPPKRIATPDSLAPSYLSFLRSSLNLFARCRALSYSYPQLQRMRNIPALKILSDLVLPLSSSEYDGCVDERSVRAQYLTAARMLNECRMPATPDLGGLAAETSKSEVSPCWQFLEDNVHRVGTDPHFLLSSQLPTHQLHHNFTDSVESSSAAVAENDDDDTSPAVTAFDRDIRAHLQGSSAMSYTRGHNGQQQYGRHQCVHEVSNDADALEWLHQCRLPTPGNQIDSKLQREEYELQNPRASRDAHPTMYEPRPLQAFDQQHIHSNGLQQPYGYHQCIPSVSHSAAVLGNGVAVVPHMAGGYHSEVHFSTVDCEIAPYDVVIEGKVGGGATSEVYRGVWRGTEVAVKRIALHAVAALLMVGGASGSASAVESAAVRELHRELSILLRLRHPNLGLVMGANLTRQPSFLVMEFCAGGTLFELLHGSMDKYMCGGGGIQLSLRQKLKLALDVAKGCTYLHACCPPIIHRDLKSLNILLADKVVADGTFGPDTTLPPAKVVDFGLSRVVCASWDSVSNGMTGTMQWMAPEVIRGDSSCDASVDIYSFGIVLYEILCQRIPYIELGSNQENPVMIGLHVLKGGRPDLRYMPRGYNPKLRQLMLSCWAEDASQRPQFMSIVVLLKQVVCE
eukprot:Lankesteria_metandrocarpae@DN3094_c0_g1_i1.p1